MEVKEYGGEEDDVPDVLRSLDCNNPETEMLRLLCICFCYGSQMINPLGYEQELKMALEFI